MPKRYYIGNPRTILTTLNTVAIGIRKQNLAGGADANESKSF